MANISFIVKQKLESAIKILCRDFSSHVKRPGKDFSRNRKLPFEEVIRFLLPLQGQCMDQELFRRDEIWFVERDADNASKIYSLDRFKERYDKKFSKAYLDG